MSEGSALEAGNLRPVFCLVFPIRLHRLHEHVNILYQHLRFFGVRYYQLANSLARNV